MTTLSFVDGAIDRVASFLAREVGIACPPERRRDLERAIAATCRAAEAADADALLALLPERPALLDDLAGTIAVGETYFFRDPGQFELLRWEILPDLVQAHGPALRLWSAGCASGEEAYSLAILLAEQSLRPELPVLGTDVSRAALRRAEDGRYGDWSFRGVPQRLRDGYFARDGARSVVNDEIRRRTRFEWLNLASDAYPSSRSGIHGMHVVFCRNVLLYLTPDAVAHVARRLYESLAPDGWLLTSPTDPPLAELAPFSVVTTAAGLVYRRPQDPVAASSSVFPMWEPALAAGSPAPPTPPPASVAAPASTVADRTVRGAWARPQARREDGREASLAAARAHLRDLMDRGWHADAASAVERATRAFPLDAELRYLAALVLLERGRDAEAAAEARRALYLDPTLAVAAIALGSALRRIGDLRAARQAYRSAVTLLADAPADAPVPLADGERAGGLRRAVGSLLALAGERP